MELGIPFGKIRQGLETVEGVQRRLEIKGEAHGIIVVDDYGHHPTEIKLTLQSVKEIWPGRRIVVAFQPHRYTRISALFDDFARAFYQSDVLVVLPIYSAGEQRIEGIDGQGICEAIRAHGHREVVFRQGPEAILYLQKNLKEGDILLTLGAGNVWKVGEEVLKVMKSD